jgi:hypothetical protein
MTEADIKKLESQSVQVLPDAVNGSSFDFFSLNARGPLLDRWGSRNRERQLREYYRHDYSWMVQGAFAGIMNMVATTPWKIKGPDDITPSAAKFWKQVYKANGFGNVQTVRPDIEYYQAILRQADFGRGWDTLIKKGVDYLRQDAGWFIEIIAPGDASAPPTGPITGIAHLDSVRCYPTGDPEFPVLYYNRNGKLFKLHHTRVKQLTDMPDGEESRPGYGLCALSRAISIAYREVQMGQYVEESLDDKPKPGIAVASNMGRNEREVARKAYEKEQSTDQTPLWGKTLWLFSQDAENPVKLDFFNFTQPPEKFDFKLYTELDIDALALAVGVDRQDLWQLTTGNIGSATQSLVMAQKSRGKTIGNLRGQLERFINDLLPEEYTFGFEYRDAQEDQERASTASTWATTIATLPDLQPNERRRMAANTIEAAQNAITDEDGTIRQVDDADVQPPAALVEVLPAANPQPNTDLLGQGQPVNAGGTDSAVRSGPELDADVGGRGDMDTRQKAITATRIDFELAFADLITARENGDITASRFTTVGRALLRKTGLLAIRDGLEDGGVKTTDADGVVMPLEPDEQAIYDNWLIEQSAYLADFAKTLTKGAEPDADFKAGLWANKSIMPIYNEGIMSADKNGTYMWVYGDTEHCPDCLRLNGQVHRLRNFISRGWIPQSDKLACKGFFCKCKFVKTNRPISGGY